MQRGRNDNGVARIHYSVSWYRCAVALRASSLTSWDRLWASQGKQWRMLLRRRMSAVLVALLVPAVVGCGDDGAGQQPSGGQKTTNGGTSNGGGDALGGDARVRTLARAPLESQPADNAAWNALRVTLERGEKVEHEHAFSTVYAEEGGHRLTVGSGPEQEIEPKGGATVQAQARHVHEAPEDERSVFWDVVLDERGAELPGVRSARRVFATEPLEGIPERAEVAFLDVVLPPGGGRTTVHTHPGPETIYITSGPFEYENAIEGSTTVDDGDLKSIPPNTGVQKRNPGDGNPRFLSWFIVDPSKEFAPPTEFDSGG
jgi:quercetin dioxygenase-like cupin family protein